MQHGQPGSAGSDGGGAARGRAFAAQVRYSGAEPWVTVERTGTRGEAASAAARAFTQLTDRRGRFPWQVRIATAVEDEAA